MGRNALYLVIGLSFLFLYRGLNFSRVSNDAFDNYLSYYKQTVSHNIATSGANIGANMVFENPTWRGGYSNLSLSGGIFSLSVTDIGGGKIQLLAWSSYQGLNDTVTVIMQPSSFSKYAYYTVNEGSVYWITGDTVWGPVHTESRLNISGSPVFYGKVTAKNGTNPRKPAAKFYGGYQSGVSVPIQTDLSALTNAASSTGIVFNSTDLWLTFNADGTVSYRTTAGGTDSTVALSTFAPGGVILVDKGNIHVKGTLNGKVTIGALSDHTGTTNGNVWIDDDIVYHKNPLVDPTSNDFLGIVSENNVEITDNTPNLTDVNIMGTIYAANGSFTAQHYNTKAPSGTIYLLGGVTQNTRGPVGQFSGSTIINGYQKNYKYDDRFLLKGNSPPAFPLTGQYEILSWRE